MDFLGIGGWEILLILFIALLVLGPGKAVEMGRTLGRIVHAFRKATSELTAQVTREIELEEQNKILKKKEEPSQPPKASTPLTGGIGPAQQSKAPEKKESLSQPPKASTPS